MRDLGAEKGCFSVSLVHVVRGWSTDVLVRAPNVYAGPAGVVPLVQLITYVLERGM